MLNLTVLSELENEVYDASLFVKRDSLDILELVVPKSVETALFNELPDVDGSEVPAPLEVETAL